MPSHFIFLGASPPPATDEGNQHVITWFTCPKVSLRLPHFILAKHHNIKSCILSTQRPKHPGRISFGSSVDWRPRSLEGRRKKRVRTQILITPWMSLDIKGKVLNLLLICFFMILQDYEAFRDVLGTFSDQLWPLAGVLLWASCWE